MDRSSARRMTVLTAAIAVLAGSFVGVSAPPAGATFPGSNGSIVFSGDGDGDAEIYTIPSAKGLETQLTFNDVDDEHPTYSANGHLIYWDSELPSGKHVIWVIKPSGAGEKKLTSSTKDSWDPAPSPDGKKIAFVRTVSGNSEIFVMNSDGSGVTQLTDTGRYADEPDWSPNGKLIAFVRSYKFYSTLFTMTPAGKHKTPITAEGADYYDPSFSPDSKRIAVDSDLTAPSDIYTMKTDGTDLQQITSGAGQEILPQYSPDGMQLSYSDVGASTEIVRIPVGGGIVTPVTADAATNRNGGWQAG